jgi:hypothetical protein
VAHSGLILANQNNISNNCDEIMDHTADIAANTATSNTGDAALQQVRGTDSLGIVSLHKTLAARTTNPADTGTPLRLLRHCRETTPRREQRCRHHCRVHRAPRRRALRALRRCRLPGPGRERERHTDMCDKTSNLPITMAWPAGVPEMQQPTAPAVPRPPDSPLFTDSESSKTPESG